MTRTVSFSVSATLVTGLFLAPAVRAADIDSVYRKSDGKLVGGEIRSVTRTEVVVFQRVGNKEERVPANDIATVEWKGEPASLPAARSNERSGNFTQALNGYQESLPAVAGNALLRADVEFLIARTSARMAQQDAQQTAAALEKLQNFLKASPDHFRYYEAQQLLADLALQSGDSLTAETAYKLLEQAPWPEVKMAGRLGIARGRLARHDIDGAKTIFDEIAAHTPANDAERARRFEAMLGQANCLKERSHYPQAVAVLQQVIDGTSPGDTRLLAEAYVRQGDCLAASAETLKEAVLAYLHVDVVPTLAAQRDFHAEALYHLARLWPAIGHPARGAEAAAKLEQDYPTSPWTKKLESGS